MTREFFRFLKFMIGDLSSNEESIPFFCNYYEQGKYATEQTEDGWPVLEDFDEMTYPFHLVIGPANKNNLHKLSIIQNPDSEGYKDNLLEILDMTECGDDADAEDGIRIGSISAEHAFDYVSEKYKEHKEEWLKLMPWY